MPIPLAAKASGIFYGSKESSIQIDMFIDIQCPHSCKAWPNIVDLMNGYDDNDIGIRLHLITLSNHRQSWDISKAIFAMSHNDDELINAIDFYFDRQDEFLNKPFLDKTHQQLLDYIADTAAQFNDSHKDALLEKMDGGDIYETARTPNRYAAERGVWGTPTFFINHSHQLTLNHASTVNDWKAVIDPLLKMVKDKSSTIKHHGSLSNKPW